MFLSFYGTTHVSLFHDGSHYHKETSPFDFLCKSIDRFLYDSDFFHERVKSMPLYNALKNFKLRVTFKRFTSNFNQSVSKAFT